MGNPEFRNNQEAQTVEIVQRLDGQDFLFTQRLEIRRKEVPRKVAQVAMSSPNSDPDPRGSYTPADDFDMLHYMSGDSDRGSRTTRIASTFSPHDDCDALWYQGRI